MMLSLPKYDFYKNSGVDWLGKIPSHWHITKLKFITNIYGRIGFKGYTIADRVNEGEGAISLSPSNIIDNNINYENRAYISWDKYEESPEIKVYEQDIIFVKTGSTIGKVAIVRNSLEKMTINPQLVVLKDIKCQRYFLNYFMKSPFYQYQIYTFRVGGSTPTMTQDSLKSTYIVIPPLEEQERIVKFLDRKCEEVEKSIALKQRLIILLEEQSAIVINQAVTKGLNPNAPMKDSGIDWLGDIPSHWEIVPLKWYISVSSGEFIGVEKVKRYSSDLYNIPVIGGNGITGFTNYYNTLPNNIIVGRVGALCGNIHLFKHPIWVTDNALKISFSQDFLQKYLGLFLQTLNLNKLANKNAQPLITGSQVKSQYASLPPIEEQEKIVEYLEQKTAEIEELKEKTLQQIEKLKEFKQILIAEAVTGKIKV